MDSVSITNLVEFGVLSYTCIILCDELQIGACRILPMYNTRCIYSMKLFDMIVVYNR